MLDWLRRRTHRATKEQEKVVRQLGSDIAWSESQIYSIRDFEKYNPDELIGKKGAAIYQKMLLDEQVKAVVKFKRDAITSRDILFMFDEDVELSDTEKKFRIGFFRHLLRSMTGSFLDGLNFVMAGMYHGFSLTEKIFGLTEYQGKTYIGLERLMPKPFDSFTFSVDRYGKTLEVLQELDGEEQKIDLTRFIYYVQNPEYDEHYGQSDLREAYRSWFAKDAIIKFWNIHMERFATGFVWAQAQGDKTIRPNTQEYNLLTSALENIQNTTSMLVPTNVNLNMEQPQNTDAYQHALTFHNQAISKALLVPNLLGVTEQGQTGSFSQAAVQQEAFLWTLDADTGRLEEVLNEQLISELGVLNFADGIAPRLKFKPISDKKRDEIIKQWASLLQAGGVIATESDEAHIRELLEFPAAAEPLTPPASGPTPPSVTPSPDGDQVPVGEGGESVAEETVSGIPIIVTPMARNNAEKRVSTTVIDRQTRQLLERHTDSLAEAIEVMVDAAADEIREKDLGTPAGGPLGIAKLDFPTRLKQKTRKTSEAALKAHWRLGEKHARDEVNRARGESFRVDMERIADMAAEWLAARGFEMAGDLTEATLKIIKNELQSGLKYSWTPKAILDRIYFRLAVDGLITLAAAAAGAGRTVDDMREALGDASLTPHRLRTTIRTVGFEAINEARYSYFTDPELGGFVEAFQYSAILDARTTDICRHLDDRVYPVDAPEWNSIRPPNHFNCRSILVPVTVIDTEVAGKDHPEGQRWSREPTKQPQTGFGGATDA